MRRLVPAIAAVLVPLLAAGCGGTSSAAGHPGKPVQLGVPLPQEVSSKGTLTVGVACDYPPFGAVDVSGQHAGYDVAVAHTLAQDAFGDPGKAGFTCVTPSNRIPYLTTGKIDLIISTLGYTPDRAKVISYSSPYFTSGVKLLVLNGSPVTSWGTVSGQTIISKKGTTASIYLQKCQPHSPLRLYDTTSEAVTALQQHRGAAFAEDGTLLLGLAVQNKKLSVQGDAVAATPWGLGLRQGDTAMKKWVDAALAKMQAEDKFWTIFQAAVPQKGVVEAFTKSMPRPGHSLSYPTGDPYTC